MTTDKKVAVVVVNYRTPHYAVRCVRSLVPERQKLPGLEVVVIDNASGDGSVDHLRENLGGLVRDGFVTLLPQTVNGGFGWANNQALLRLFARDHPPEFVMLLNPDCEISSDAVLRLCCELDAHPECAVAGSQLFNPDGSWTGSAFRFPSPGREFVRGAQIAALGKLLGIAPIFISSELPCEVDWVTGASCLFRAQALRKEGLFDDGFFLYFEEVELMHRLRKAGWTIRHVPESKVVHIGGVATGLREGKATTAATFPRYWFQSRRRFFALAYGRLWVILANLAWLHGSCVNRLAALVWPSKAHPTAAAERRALLAHGISASKDDCTPARVGVSDLPGHLPRWMNADGVSTDGG